MRQVMNRNLSGSRYSYPKQTRYLHAGPVAGEAFVHRDVPEQIGPLAVPRGERLDGRAGGSGLTGTAANTASTTDCV